MKRLASFILVFIFALSALASCGESVTAPDRFIEIPEGSAVTLNFASGGAPKKIDTPSLRAKAVEAYNSVTTFGKYDTKADASSSVVLTAASDGGQSVFLISRLGGGRFNVSVNGAAADGGNYKFLVENEALETFYDRELMTINEIDATVSVRFVLAEGTPDENGALRASDETLSERDVTVHALEINMPSVLEAVVKALDEGDIEFAANEKSGFPKEIAGYGDVVEAGDEGVTHLSWVYELNGESLGAGGAAATDVTDGDVITVRYTSTFVPAE